MTSMLFCICVCACADMGRTAPTSLPDSISSSEGMSPPESFSRSLRKLAKGDLLVEFFSALCSCFLSREAAVVHRNHTTRFPPVRETTYLIVFNLLSLTVCGGGLGKRRECTKIGELPPITESGIRPEAEIIMFDIDESRIDRQIRYRLEFRSL